MKQILALLLVLFILFSLPTPTLAADFGVHILNPDEINAVVENKPAEADHFFVTVPLPVTETDQDKWQHFFDISQKHNITPLVRLVTTVTDGVWARPNRKQIVDAITFLDKLNWPEPRYLILFNEPNHAAEWGGQVDPEDFAETAMFTARWLQTEPRNYQVLSPGMDAAAPNGTSTMDSFTFLDRLISAEPELLYNLDGWTSHSYPNPGFVSSAYGSGKQSIRGFEEELTYLGNHGRADLPVFITETGWRQTRSTTPKLAVYYQYAKDNVWNHPQVKAVTVFLLQGSASQFAEFSLLYPDGSPTPQLEAYQKIFKIPGS